MKKLLRMDLSSLSGCSEEAAMIQHFPHAMALTGFISTASSSASWKALGTAHCQSPHLPKIVLGSCSISSSYCDLGWERQETEHCCCHQPVLHSQEGQFLWGDGDEPHLLPWGTVVLLGQTKRGAQLSNGDIPTFSSWNRSSF